jgi:hypothetical protein
VEQAGGHRPVKGISQGCLLQKTALFMLDRPRSDPLAELVTLHRPSMSRRPTLADCGIKFDIALPNCPESVRQ